MANVTLLGVVLPPVAKFNNTEPTPFDATLDLTGFGLAVVDVKMSVKFTDGSVAANCEINPFSREILREVFKVAIEIIRAPIVLHGFKEGRAYDLHLHTILLPDGNEFELDYRDHRLSALATNLGSDADFFEVLTLLAENRSLAWALHDLTRTLMEPDLDIQNVARVFDAIRKMMFPRTKNAITAWKKMQEALNLGPDYMSPIGKLATEPRHGNRELTHPDKITRHAVERGWKVMNRFIELKRRQLSRLPRAEFPLLVE
jgi:hypothetical protein